jgi:GNAT acetyltransferase-like protein
VNIHIIDPLIDPRWDELVARHASASVFHQRGWLEALVRTYGFKTMVLTTSPPGQRLDNGLVLCWISSWITGTRLVSLPFADHCEPLLNGAAELTVFTEWLRGECKRKGQRYVELRSLLGAPIAISDFQPKRSYWIHELDLEPSLQQLFRGLHKNSFQRKIRRAERERLSYEVGRSQRLMDEFYRLLLKTRRRHGLLPQPRLWFRNLVECMGDKVDIRMARKNDTPIAAILTLRHPSSPVYKYGCSDAKLHNLGGMPFLFWRLIEESKVSGVEKVDFGRSDLDQYGLIVFKDRLGTRRKLLTYYRHTNGTGRRELVPWKSRWLRNLVSNLPDFLMSVAGRILYKHLG